MRFRNGASDFFVAHRSERGPSPKGLKDQGDHRPKDLLAEHPLVVETELRPRIDAVGAEPPLTVVEAVEIEDARTAVRVDDGLHGERKPLVAGLIGVGDAQHWAVLGDAAIETKLLRTLQELLERRRLGETE